MNTIIIHLEGGRGGGGGGGGGECLAYVVTRYNYKQFTVFKQMKKKKVLRSDDSEK